MKYSVKTNRYLGERQIYTFFDFIDYSKAFGFIRAIKHFCRSYKII